MEKRKWRAKRSAAFTKRQKGGSVVLRPVEVPTLAGGVVVAQITPEVGTTVTCTAAETVAGTTVTATVRVGIVVVAHEF